MSGVGRELPSLVLKSFSLLEQQPWKFGSACPWCAGWLSTCPWTDPCCSTQPRSQGLTRPGWGHQAHQPHCQPLCGALLARHVWRLCPAPWIHPGPAAQHELTSPLMAARVWNCRLENTQEMGAWKKVSKATPQAINDHTNTYIKTN